MTPNDKPSLKKPIAVATKPFMQMNGGEKVVHIGKVLLFLVTAGFAFPTIFND
jgi:hypothetical protein